MTRKTENWTHEYEIIIQLHEYYKVYIQAGSVSVYGGDLNLQKYFLAVQQIEWRMMNMNSIAKREVEDEEFWFRLTFITCP